ncbi:MAG: guanylate kinase [Bacillota bacterium]
MNKGILMVLSGPSGVGKGTIKEILKTRINLIESVSATTRNKREGEVHGVSYYFISNEEFDRKVENGEFLEHFNNFGKKYGTLKSVVAENLEKGDVLLEIDVQGALEVKKKMPEAVLIMVAPPKISDLKHRLEKRGTESAEEIQNRFNLCKKELALYESYDYLVVNGDLEKAVCDVEKIIQTEKMKSTNNHEGMKEILNS